MYEIWEYLLWVWWRVAMIWPVSCSSYIRSIPMEINFEGWRWWWWWWFVFWGGGGIMSSVAAVQICIIIIISTSITSSSSPSIIVLIFVTSSSSSTSKQLTLRNKSPSPWNPTNCQIPSLLCHLLPQWQIRIMVMLLFKPTGKYKGISFGWRIADQYRLWAGCTRGRDTIPNWILV